MRVNCGAIPHELIDSQLFGHEKGAFTGATECRQGWFERADGGTLLLDELGELPLAAQVRLLRVLQDGWLDRVGSQKPVSVDVRILAATHRDLPRMVAEGKFREDLWYRLAVFPIVIPSLREHREDIPELARHFAARAAARFGLYPVEPTEEDIGLLISYSWPGNIRELAAVIDRAAILGDGKQLEVAKSLGLPSLPFEAKSALPEFSRASPKSIAAADIAPLEDVVRRHIESALAAASGRIEGTRGAAQLLKINPHTLPRGCESSRSIGSNFAGEGSHISVEFHPSPSLAYKGIQHPCWISLGSHDRSAGSPSPNGTDCREFNSGDRLICSPSLWHGDCSRAIIANGFAASSVSSDSSVPKADDHPEFDVRSTPSLAPITRQPTL